MTVKELYERLTLAFPASLSCEWDRDGLSVCPDEGLTVGRVLVTLDVTPDAVSHATAEGCNLILSHHPLLFHPLDSLCESDPRARKILPLVRAGISCMSFHTRADAAHGGVSDLLASAVGLSNTETVGEEKILRVGSLPSPLSPRDFALLVKQKLGTPAVTLADAGKPVRWVAVCGGEGGDFPALALSSGADALLAGRIGYHRAQDAREAGLTCVEAGHYYSEAPVLDYFASLVKDSCGLPVTVHREPPIAVL